MSTTQAACLAVTLTAGRPQADVMAEAIRRALREHKAREPTR
jgi:hypothetical protein